MFSALFDAQTLAFLAVAAALAMTPGADTLLVIKNSVRSGPDAGWATTLGILSGVLFHAVLSAVGLSVVVARSDAVFLAVKGLGALYLVWLGVVTWRNAASRFPSASGPTRAVTAAASFREGLITNVLNPKVAIFYIAFLPQFISVDDPVLLKSLLLATIHNGFSLIWLGGIVWAIQHGQHWFERPDIQRTIARISGALLIGLGVRLALASR